MRIVSLVPSLTELVFWLDRGEVLAGRTRFCTEPEGEVERVPIVGGTKNPRCERIVALKPDLVLANKEENRREDIEALRAAGLEVLLTDPNTVAEAATMIRQVGDAVGAASKANELADHVDLLLAAPPPSARRVFVPIWKDPLMGLGGAAYGHDLIEQAGAINVLGAMPRYPEVTIEEVAALKPDLILLPDEPYPFKPADVEHFARVAPATIVDGRLLWWYGPRIPEALSYFRTLFAEGMP